MKSPSIFRLIFKPHFQPRGHFVRLERIVGINADPQSDWFQLHGPLEGVAPGRRGQDFFHSFWPRGVKLAVRNGMTASGAAMVIALLWQGFIVTVMVPALIATPMIFVVASLFTIHTGVATIGAMVSMQRAL